MDTLNDRLWGRIAVGTDDVCWEWQGGQDKDGYGKIRAAGKHRRVHAVALEQATGELASGRVAMHSCDNPACCNPKHLSWGTHADNHADSKRKGRRAAGEANGQSKLTRDQVAAIRAEHVRRCPVQGTFALAAKYGVSKNTIDLIVHNHTWEH